MWTSLPVKVVFACRSLRICSHTGQADAVSAPTSPTSAASSSFFIARPSVPPSAGPALLFCLRPAQVASCLVSTVRRRAVAEIRGDHAALGHILLGGAQKGLACPPGRTPR